jgi:hypothetical protein
MHISFLFFSISFEMIMTHFYRQVKKNRDTERDTNGRAKTKKQPPAIAPCRKSALFEHSCEQFLQTGCDFLDKSDIFLYNKSDNEQRRDSNV